MTAFRNTPPPRKNKIYVSYDFDTDKSLKNEIVAESQKENANFKVANWSMKPDNINGKWQKEAKFRITRCDIMLVLTGENSFLSEGIKTEVAIANAVKMKIIQLKTHDSFPDVEGAGKSHDWAEDTLHKLLG